MSNPGEINIILADDSLAIRAGIRALLRRDPQMCLVGEAKDGAEAIDLIERFRPRIALLDIEMPNLDGIETARLLNATYPEVHVIFLSAYEDPIFIQATREAGCSGYIVKDQAPKTLIPTLRSISRGNHPLPQ